MADDDLDKVLRAVHLILRSTRSTHLAGLVRERAGVGPDRAINHVLGQIRDMQPVRLTDLAVELGVDVSTVSRQVTHLEDRGFVVRTRDPDDGRASKLWLTPEGAEVTRRMTEAWHATITGLLEDWPADRVAAFAEMLEEFTDRLAGLTD